VAATELLTKGLLGLMVRFPILAGAIGLVVAGMFGMLGVLSWQSLQEYGDQPRHISLSTSGQEITEQNEWVVIEDAKWDCSSMAPFGSGTDKRAEAMFTDESGKVLVVALLPEKVSCAELTASPPTGEIHRMSEYHHKHLTSEARLDKYTNATTYLDMCTYCGPTNSRLGVILGLIFVPLGLALYPLSLYLRRVASQASP
jgi:hypothetical protein